MRRAAFWQRWYWAALGFYALALGVLLHNHEPWRDEIQAWLLARDSGSLFELWRNTRYEGHPLLWHLLLWVLSRWSQNPATMQAAHGFIAVVIAGVFLASAPFSRLIRVLWVLGYFPLFEYGVISRNYGLAVLCLFAALAFRAAPMATAVALGLAANASPMGVLLVPLLAPVLMAKEKTSLAPAFVLGLCWLLAVFTCLPPPDYEHARGMFWQWDTLRAYYVLRGTTTAFLPIFRPELHFWNNPMFFPFPPAAPGTALFLAALVLLALITLALLNMGRKWELRAAYLGGLAILLAFFYIKFPGSTRHHGFVLIWTVVFCWLPGERVATKPRLHGFFFPLTVTAGLVGSIVASWVELRHPFSSGKLVAQVVVQSCGSRLVVGHPDWAASTVAGYLPRGAVFYATTRSPGSFVVWNLNRAQRERLPDEALVETGTQLKACLLVNRPLLKSEPCLLLTQLPPAVVADEQFWLYRCWPEES